jgi:hypothetical protein
LYNAEIYIYIVDLANSGELIRFNSERGTGWVCLWWSFLNEVGGRGLWLGKEAAGGQVGGRGRGGRKKERGTKGKRNELERAFI